MIDILDRDNPILQFNGPLAAAVILAKHRETLALLLPDTDLLASDTKLSEGLFDLLYNDANAELRSSLVSKLAGVEGELVTGEALNTAFTNASGLTSFQKVKSLDYINHFFAADPDFLEALAPKVEPHIHDDNIVVVNYENATFRNHLTTIAPMARPSADYLVNTLHLCANVYQLNTYIANYYSSYDDYAAYYADQYEGFSQTRQLLGLKAYIERSLSESGITSRGKTYKYKGAHFSDGQLDRVTKAVIGESGVANNLALSIAGWKSLYTPYKRTLDQQIIASISECSKSDKSLARLIR